MRALEHKLNMRLVHTYLHTCDLNLINHINMNENIQALKFFQRRIIQVLDVIRTVVLA